jgi:branched-chain amino acid transport system ATP-binding protein
VEPSDAAVRGEDREEERRARTAVVEHVATADLRREHELILRAATVLERAGRRLAAEEPVEQALLVELVRFLRTLAEECHHRKEEDHLYPAMRRKSLTADGRLSSLLAAHGEGRDYLSTLAGPASAAERAAAALLFVGVTREHIRAEDREIFPAADAMLLPAEQVELDRAYREMELRRFGPAFRERVLTDLVRLERAVAPETG